MKHPTPSPHSQGEMHHLSLAIIRNLIMSELDDFIATLEVPGGHGTPGQIHRDLKLRIDNAIDYYRHNYHRKTNRKAP